MDIAGTNTSQPPKPNSTAMKKAILILNCLLLVIGNCGGPLITRLYFLHGGNRVWLSSNLMTVGWPIALIPLFLCYLRRRSQNPAAGVFLIKLPLFLAGAFIGFLTGVDNYLYVYGVARLPVSTSALIVATQLAFTAFFAYLLVKQKFTAFSTNAIVLLSVGAGVLAMHASGDRPAHETTKEYVLGFVMTLGSALLYGFVLPLVELTYKKAKQEINYTLVLEFQMVISLAATVFCVIGMVIDNDFKVIPREGREFGLGETKYYVILIFSGIIWQCFFIGAIGVIFCSSSLLSAVLITVLLPVIEILGVIFYRENFGSEKGVSLALSLWGFASYIYGEHLTQKQQPKNHIATHNKQVPLSSANSTQSV